MSNQNDNQENIDQAKLEELKKAKAKLTPTKMVTVFSKTLSQEKIVVVFKKIKPQQGHTREAFNIYLFDYEGKCKMLERDAILFAKQRAKMEGMENDIKIMDVKHNFTYQLSKMKDLYEIEEVGLEDSRPR